MVLPRKLTQAIEKKQEARSSGFSLFRKRVDTSNAETLQKYKEIVSWPFLELRSRLQRDEITAVEALEAYVWKAMEVQQRLNCCMEVIKEVHLSEIGHLFSVTATAVYFQAFGVAAEADKKWSGVESKPPMYGIPFSVKGNFYV
ncbi:hypothetical protein KIN20_014409 [Parelaphostrongylus tenuis]|uniref:Amidase domain-containing protein n=1 Tax=Parelaphostrongylus tenuis TaxID=148309 RepID=A0AAD5MDM9_PARTN|nr:hypothetical protein KIN20_014409 [Parelaphostrongylus tenuis]